MDTIAISNINDVLPTEILQLCFLIGMWSSPSRELLPFPVTASHVCRHWRCAALACSSLWTKLDINNKDYIHPHRGLFLALPTLFSLEETTHVTSESMAYTRIECWIKRSRGALLHIDISAYLGTEFLDFSARDIDLVNLLEYLRPTIHRWSSFSLHGHHLDLIIPRLSAFPEAPHLELLALCDPMRPVIQPGETAKQLFAAGIPKLRRLHVSITTKALPWSTNVFRGLNFLAVEIFWRTVTLSSQPKISEVMQVLQHCTLLDTFILSDLSLEGGSVRFDNSWRPHGDILLSSLRRLSFQRMQPIYVAAIFESLDLPSLEEAVFSFSQKAELTDYNQQALISTAQKMVRTSGKGLSIMECLKNIHFDGMFCDISVINALLENATALQWIQIDGEGQKNILSSLASDRCPSLVELRIDQIGEESLRELVDARVQNHVPLAAISTGEYLRRLDQDRGMAITRIWAREIQRIAFTPEPSYNGAKRMADIFSELEAYDQMSRDYVKLTRIEKLMEQIQLMPDSQLPHDGTFHLRDRARILKERWMDLADDAQSHHHVNGTVIRVAPKRSITAEWILDEIALRWRDR